VVPVIRLTISGIGWISTFWAGGRACSAGSSY
jgi:hypothetical protein